MSEVDEWPTTPADEGEGGTGSAPFGNFGVDVRSLAAQLVDDAVQKAIAKQVADVSKEAVEEVFTEDVLEEFRNRAQSAASEAMARQLEASASEPPPEPQVPEEVILPEPEPKLVYASVIEWFDQWMRHMYKRVLTGRGAPCWDPEWWQHDEALSRLDALWRAWEHLRLDAATGLSAWWRDHADHHMSVLMSEHGPFGASQVRCDRGEPLPHTNPPEGIAHFGIPESET